MRLTGTSPFRLLATMFLLVGCLAAWAQQTLPAGAAPVPTKIVEAKEVFIANAGVDAASPVVIERTISPNEPYSQFDFVM